MPSTDCLRRRSPRSKNCCLPSGNLHRRTLLETRLWLLAGRRNDHEENLYGQTGPVPGFHLLLQQNPRMLAVGGRAAAPLSSLSAFCASDDLNARSTRPHRANARASAVNPAFDPSRGDTGLGLGCPLGTRRTVNVEKLLQFLSSRWLKGGQVAGEFIWVEDVPHLGLKTRKLSGELRVPICRLSEIQQFFTEKITQRALHAEPLFDPAGCPTLLQPDLVELHAGNYIAGDPKTQSTPGKTAGSPQIKCIPLNAYVNSVYYSRERKIKWSFYNEDRLVG